MECNVNNRNEYANRKIFSVAHWLVKKKGKSLALINPNDKITSPKKVVAYSKGLTIK